MRIVADTSLPPIVSRYLLSDERQVITVRVHPARFIPPLVTTLGALSLAIALSPVLRGAAAVAAWLITLVLIGNLAYTAVDWLFRYLVITSRRIFLVSGSGITQEWQLAEVKDVRLTLTIGGRLLGYGTLIFDSGRLVVDSVPYPHQLYLEILGLLYKDRDAGHDADREG
ncbi:PH domain-containing protein [Trebonia sp.]|uniref:PH domain-containing protein n=1 Tax=Trebonia sp. TaxID=2767075 RepID=UPI003CA691CA